jgi:iron(III) transport system substrate-binding protein
MHMRRACCRSAALLVFIASLGFLAGALRAQSWTEIEAAARKEGAVVLYHNFQPASAERIVAAFNADYPDIKVGEVRLASGAFYPRFAAEYAGGKSEADACSASWDERLQTWAQQGWMAEWQPPEATQLPEDSRYDNRMWAIQAVREMIIFNTRKVSAAEAPKDWPDLFDAKWKGRVGMNPPWRSTGPQTALAFLEKKHGMKDLAERMKALDVRFFNGSAGVIQAVTRGDVSVALLTDLPLNAALADGVPLQAVYPPSGVPFLPIVTFVPAKAAHPNAGRVIVNWLMSEKGQTAIQELSGAPGTRRGLKAPEHVPSNGQIAAVAGTQILDAQTQKRIVDHWRSVFQVQ